MARQPARFPSALAFYPGMVLQCTTNADRRVTVARVDRKGVAVLTDGTRMGGDGRLRARGQESLCFEAVPSRTYTGRLPTARPSMQNIPIGTAEGTRIRQHFTPRMLLGFDGRTTTSSEPVADLHAQMAAILGLIQ